jgi:hypothetical protein
LIGVRLRVAIKRAPHINVVNLWPRITAEDSPTCKFVEQLQRSVDGLWNLVDALDAEGVGPRLAELPPLFEDVAERPVRVQL